MEFIVLFIITIKCNFCDKNYARNYYTFVEKYMLGTIWLFPAKLLYSNMFLSYLGKFSIFVVIYTNISHIVQIYKKIIFDHNNRLVSN